ncbi:MAG: hypothetical protein AABX40_09235 [Candidatus Hydrothermarchaeota archaeon]
MTKLVHVFIYDVGGELTPRDARDLCAAAGEIKTERISELYTDYFIELGMIPVRALVEEGEAEVEGRKVRLATYVKVMVFGVVMIEFVLDFGISLGTEELKAVAWSDRLKIGGKEEKLQELARAEFERIMALPVRRFRKTYEPPEFVDIYRIVVDREPRSKETICSIILNEDEGLLSPDLVAGMMRNASSYSKKDAVVVSTTSSYIYSEAYPEDEINLIELSRVQLFELKVYDIILDREMGRAYSLLEGTPLKRLRFRVFSGDYRRLSQVAFGLMELRVELLDLIKDVMNSTKVTSDTYLAYLYRRVNREFRIEEWYEGTKSKLEELEDVYTMAIDRLEMHRSYTLELLILIVIVIEVLLFIWK